MLISMQINLVMLSESDLFVGDLSYFLLDIPSFLCLNCCLKNVNELQGVRKHHHLPHMMKKFRTLFITIKQCLIQSILIIQKLIIWYVLFLALIIAIVSSH